MPCKECLEIVPTAEQFEKYGSVEPAFLNELQFEGDQSVLYFPIEHLIDDLKDESDDIKCTEQNNSDVIPGVYEGKSRFESHNSSDEIMVVRVIPFLSDDHSKSRWR